MLYKKQAKSTKTLLNCFFWKLSHKKLLFLLCIGFLKRSRHNQLSLIPVYSPKTILLAFQQENVLFSSKVVLFERTVSTFFSKMKFPRNQQKKVIPISRSYVLTLIKKIKNFFRGDLSKKFEGGGKPKTRKKQYFFGLTEISGKHLGRLVHKLAEWNFLAEISPSFSGLNFDWKIKKLYNFKNRRCEILKNTVYHPLQKWTFPIPQRIPGMTRYIYWEIWYLIIMCVKRMHLKRERKTKWFALRNWHYL